MTPPALPAALAGAQIQGLALRLCPPLPVPALGLLGGDPGREEVGPLHTAHIHDGAAVVILIPPLAHAFSS